MAAGEDTGGWVGVEGKGEGEAWVREEEVEVERCESWEGEAVAEAAAVGGDGIDYWVRGEAVYCQCVGGDFNGGVLGGERVSGAALLRGRG